MVNLDNLIDRAVAEATEIRTITRCDGSTYEGAKGYGSADNGTIQAYVVSCGRRISNRRNHYRVMFYVKKGEGWKRVKRTLAEAYGTEASGA